MTPAQECALLNLSGPAVWRFPRGNQDGLYADVWRLYADTRKRPSKARPKRVKRSLSHLLDTIDEAFENVTAPIEWCQIHGDLRIGLRRMGPHVIPEYAKVEMIAPAMEVRQHMPGMVFVHFRNEDQIPDEVGEHQLWKGYFFYAIKHSTQPFGVSRPAGEAWVYQCGIGWARKKRTVWSQYYVGVNQVSGAIKVLTQLCNRRIDVRNSSASYNRREWVVPLAEGQDWKDDALAQWAARGMRAWLSREQMWSISVRRSGNRATFCIPVNEAPDYFHDREKTALTAGGKRRPIMHICSEHERTTATGTTMVRQHIRGLREFDWKSFHCAIIAPKWHKFVATDFDVGGEESDDEEIPPGRIGPSKVGEMLAQMEDSQQ